MMFFENVTGRVGSSRVGSGGSQTLTGRVGSGRVESSWVTLTRPNPNLNREVRPDLRTTLVEGDDRKLSKKKGDSLSLGLFCVPTRSTCVQYSNKSTSVQYQLSRHFCRQQPHRYCLRGELIVTHVNTGREKQGPFRRHCYCRKQRSFAFSARAVYLFTYRLLAVVEGQTKKIKNASRLNG